MRIPRKNPILIPYRTFQAGDVVTPLEVRTRPGVQTVVMITATVEYLETDYGVFQAVPPDYWPNFDGNLDYLLQVGQRIWHQGFVQLSIAHDPEKPLWRIYMAASFDGTPPISGDVTFGFQIWEEQLPQVVIAEGHRG